jgi:hypothetical protein
VAVEQALTRRAALGGMLTLPFARGASAEDLTKASIALLRLSSSGPISSPRRRAGSRKRASTSP